MFQKNIDQILELSGLTFKIIHHEGANLSEVSQQVAAVISAKLWNAPSSLLKQRQTGMRLLHPPCFKGK